MTKIEYIRCEKLMYDAIMKAKQAKEEYKESDKQSKNGNKVEGIVAQRCADQHYGNAVGIHDTLVVIGFEHDKMTELLKLL